MSPPADPASSAHSAPLRIAVLLSGGGRTLLNLCERIADGSLPVRVAGVVSSLRSARGVERARALGLRVKVLRPRDFASQAEFATAQAEHLDTLDVQLVIMAGYLVHFPVPERWRGRILNIHPSLLPRHGGQGMFGDRVHAAVLAAGDRESGCTVHVVDDEYDSGPVLAATRVPVHPGDDVDSLAARVFEAECETYPRAILKHARALGLLPAEAAD
ncbi:MAG: phosphoribosylglycinamide formyltransferase [Planctomycetota bacterium]|nr:MAG: phosphoribosylglycinamide formyltransferase [Planctomycetota bacterium]